MNSYRDGSSLEVIIYYGYISLISIFVLVLVTLLIREIGHENFVLLLFINALLIGSINPCEMYKWHHCTFFTIPMFTLPDFVAACPNLSSSNINFQSIYFNIIFSMHIIMIEI